MRQNTSNCLILEARRFFQRFGAEFERNWSCTGHHDRQVEGEDQHEDELGVEQANLARDQVDRQREHDRADHAVRDEPEPQFRYLPRNS